MKRKTAREILAESFRELAGIKPVDKITVPNIIENCGYSKGNQEKNKAIFAYLHQHKAAVEAKMGEPLNWLRLDEYRASTITIRLEDVGIVNEEDWIQMAKFHAEWSKKFYDVFVPLLQQWNAGQ